MSHINNRQDDWLVFAQSFLLLAKLGCQELENKRKEKHNKITSFDPQDFYFPYSHHDLFIAIIFNTKHGIEVFLKTLSIILKGNYQRGHDLKKLFEKLKDNVSTLRIKPFSDGRGNEINQEDINAFPEQIDELEKIILSYFHCDFLNGKKIVNINDEENDVFRYPENKANINIDINLIDENSIKIIHEDIDKIYRTFNDVGYLIDVYTGYKDREIGFGV